MLRRVVLVRTEVSEELSTSINRVTRIGQLGTTLAVASNRSLGEPPRAWAIGKQYQTQMLTEKFQDNRFLLVIALYSNRV
jgi:hypothetical protein